MCFGSGPDWVSGGWADRRAWGVFRGSGSVFLFAVGLQLRCKELCRDSHLVNAAERLVVKSREIESFPQRCNIVSLDFDN